MLTDDFFLGTKLYHQKLTELCQPLAKYLRVTHAMYVNIDKQGRAFSICSDYKWVERFLEEHYYEVDPLMVHPNNMHNGFAFDNSSEHREFKDTLLYDAVTKFNWCNSFAYVEKTANNSYFAFDFGTTKDNHEVINRLINESQIVRKHIRSLNKKIMALTQDLQENKMDFAALKSDAFHNQKGLVFNDLKVDQDKIQILNETGFLSKTELNSLTKISLSPQEVNCLRAYLISHNIKQVAKDLDLAASTVASYIENVKDKLQCNHKNDLIKKAEILESLGRI